MVPSGIQSTEAEGRLLSVHNSTSKPPRLDVFRRSLFLSFLQNFLLWSFMCIRTLNQIKTWISIYRLYPHILLKVVNVFAFFQVRLKFDLLSGLSKLWSETLGSTNLRHLIESTFHLVLTCLPCPSRATNGDTCRRTCHKILENFIQVKNLDLGPSAETRAPKM